MERIAAFFKVSYKQFKKDWVDTFDEPNDAELREEDVIKRIYDGIKLPVRATAGSAGYDFFSPLNFVLGPGEDIQFPTGIRCQMEDGWVLSCFPKSGLGFKYYCHMANVTGIVDGDYFYSDNEGHIMVKLRNEGDKILSIAEGDKIIQGIFFPFGITVDDHVTAKRNGGFGSTGR